MGRTTGAEGNTGKMRGETGNTRRWVEKIKRAVSGAEMFADKALLLLCALILGGLSFYSMRYTETLHEGTEIPLTIGDSMGRNLLAVLAVTVVVFLFGRFLKDKILPEGGASTQRRLRILAGCVSAYVTVISIIWVSVCHVGIKADGEMVCALATFALDGDYSFMRLGRYICYYPHQLNLLAIVQGLFALFGRNHYQAFQYMNALCMPLIFYSGYKILGLICSRVEAVLYYICLFVCYVPLFLYTAYVYGDVASVAFTMVLMWQVIRYCKSGRRSCILWGTLAVVLACMVRENSLIVLVAAGIVLAVYGFRAMKPEALVWILVMFLAVQAAQGCVRGYYERMSGQDVWDGFPYTAWMLMGLKDGACGPGWHDQADCDEFALYDYDAQRMDLDSRARLKDRFRELWEDKAYGIDFFRRKILTQWNAPMCHSDIETKVFDCEEEELPGLVHAIYYEGQAALKAFMNRYQSVLYFYATAMTVLALSGKKEKRLLENRILLIAFVGGFLFHVFWEVMGRYALPYMVYLLPIAAIGMGQVREKLDAAIAYFQTG